MYSRYRKGSTSNRGGSEDRSDHHRDVVGLRGPTGEFEDVTVDGFDDVLAAGASRSGRRSASSRSSPYSSPVAAHRFADAVGEEDEQIARFEGDRPPVHRGASAGGRRESSPPVQTLRSPSARRR